MKKTEIRSVSDLKNEVAGLVLDTIRLLETQYEAMHYKDSGHKESPTWIYRLPRYGGAEVGIRMNKRTLTLYMRDRTWDGKYLRDIIAADKVVKVYPRDGRPSASINGSMYLKPSSENELLMLSLLQEDIEPVLAAFFGELPAASFAREMGRAKNKLVTNAEDFFVSLERKSETGHLGECCALDDEIQRLKSLGCPNPEGYVRRISLIDVGARL